VRILILSRIFLAAICLLYGAAPALTQTAGHSYRYKRIGNPQDVVTKTLQGAALMGGGNDIDEAFRWLCGRGNSGDFLILTATGTDDYNPYIQKLCRMNSVATLILPDKAAAEAPFVADTIRHAEVLFITGGDQSNYIKYWQYSPVEEAINQRLRAGVPIGGTSAGLAVLGQYVFSAMFDTAVSKETLADPYNKQVTLTSDFLDVPFMQGIITDQHFVKRDRLGRFVGFMARILEDRIATHIRGIAVDQQAAVLLDEHGIGTVVGKGARVGDGRQDGKGAAYFMEPQRAPEACAPGKPLTMRDISVYRVRRGGTFDFTKWQGTGGTAYTLAAVDGKLESSNGKVY
jgi:cyanophycinase